MEITKEIQEAIKKSLPAHLSDSLKGELEELQRFRDGAYEVKQNALALERLKGQVSRYKDMEDRERALDKAKQLFEIEKREERIKMMQEKYTDTVRLMDAVFRNQRLVYHKNSTDFVPVPNNTGGYHHANGNSVSTTTVSEE